MTDATPPIPDPNAPGATVPAAPAAPTPYGTTPQPYAQGQYAQPQYAGGYAPPTNTVAIVALILAFVVPLGGIIAGHIALGQIKRTGEGGHGLALAGTVLGYVFTGLGLLIGIIYIGFFAFAASQGAFNTVY